MKIKNLILGVILVCGLGLATGYVLVQQSLKQQQASFTKARADWQAEKSALEAALATAKGHTLRLPGETKIVEVAKPISSAEILERLKTMKIIANNPRSTRVLIHQFESLIEAGPAALPAIREFLARNQDVDYDLASPGRNARDGRMPTDFNVPPSLRLGLFEVLKDIGGPEAEKILADALNVTGRGIEVAYLARVLEEMSPGKYRDVALKAARELLAHPLADAADRNDRNFLLATLAALNDPSFAAQAQAQLIQPDGKVDAAALKYLQQTQPEKSLSVAMQAYQDPRVTDAQARERLAQVALDSAGVDPMADNFFRAVLADTSLPSDNRRNLAEDFADHGFSNVKDPTPGDLQKMQNRFTQLDQLRNEATDPLVIAGIAEAQKDLTKSIGAYAVQHPAQ